MTSGTYAFITPSYAGDLERFRLQCESMDAMAQGDWRHYVLVANHDQHLFKEFEGDRRKIIPDSVLLPQWLKPIRNPFDKAARWIWIRTTIGLPVWPMSGWHVQQLRKMLIARHISEPHLVMVDSDSFFVRPFGHDRFLKDGKLRLYKKSATIVATKEYAEHIKWVRQSATILGLEPEPLPAADYIANLVSWRRDDALAMLDHIEKCSGRGLVATMGRYRTFSEYQIYGSFVDRILKSDQQQSDPVELTRTHWGKEALLNQSIADFMASIRHDQIAIGVQSFTEISVNSLREAYLNMARKLL